MDRRRAVTVLAIAGILWGCAGTQTAGQSPAAAASTGTTAGGLTPSGSPGAANAQPLDAPSMEPSEPVLPSASPEASQGSGATPSATVRPTPAPTSRPTPPPTPTPPPNPSVALAMSAPNGGGVRVEPGATAQVRLLLETEDLDQERCSLTDTLSPDDDGTPSTSTLEPLDRQTLALVDGLHEFRASCPSSAGVLKAHASVRVMDGAPIRCADWSFSETAPTASTVDDLTAGMVGSWHGCLDTPWEPTYWVELAFRGDGTYSSKADETLDGNREIGVYYGTDDDSPFKRWRIDDIQGSGLGIGAIDVVFDQGSVVRGDLRAIRLMGDRLEFEMFHMGQYGPMVFQLVRG